MLFILYNSVDNCIVFVQLYSWVERLIVRFLYNYNVGSFVEEIIVVVHVAKSYSLGIFCRC